MGPKYLGIRRVKIRPNMAELKSNYKNKSRTDLSCPLCDADENRKEHVLRCTKMSSHQCTEMDLYRWDNVSRLARLVELFQVNECYVTLIVG